MASENSVTIVGNVTRDPELRFTPSGAAVANFGVAVNRRWMNRTTNEWEEQTSFFDVVCWREMAENVTESLPKGSRVLVTGRLEQRSWETQDGDKRSKVEIIADEIGPSLRWASAQVTRNERKGGDFGGGGGGGGRAIANEPHMAQPAAQQGQPGGQPAGGGAPAFDEEPF
jgi:single-strand DNA-binding protein